MRELANPLMRRRGLKINPKSGKENSTRIPRKCLIRKLVSSANRVFASDPEVFPKGCGFSRCLSHMDTAVSRMGRGYEHVKQDKAGLLRGEDERISKFSI